MDAPGGGDSATNYFVQCQITRTEASGQLVRFVGNAFSAYYPNSKKVENYSISRAALCTNGNTDQTSLDTACLAAFCGIIGPPGYELHDFTKTDINPPPSCTATAVANTMTRNPAPGVCTPYTADKATNLYYGRPHASAHCTLSGRMCTVDKQGVDYCISLLEHKEDIQNFSGYRCFDPSKQSAYDYCANGWTYRNTLKDQLKYVELENSTAVVLQDPACTSILPSLQLSSNERAYGLTQGVVGSVSAGGQTAQLVAKSGYAVVETYCGNVEGQCTSTRLSRMKMTFMDTSILGVQFVNPTVELLGRAEISGGAIAPGGMNLIASANVQGTNAQLQTNNGQALTVSVNSTTVAISGQTTVVGQGPIGGLLDVTLNVNATASTSSPGASCVGLTREKQIMGFELDADGKGLWRSPQSSLAVSSRTPTQGCYAVDVPGSGYRVLNSVNFSTPLAGMTANLALDYFIPANPPNPYWLGAVQMYVTCPSASLNNAYIGQVDLTGKPAGAYSTLTFPIPSWIRTPLAAAHSDCSFSIALYSDQMPTAPTLDNLRFVQ